MMELVLTRIFSVKLYYHFAFMVISLALFGSGASGIYVYLFPILFSRERLGRQLYRFSLLFAASIPIVLCLILELDFELAFSAGMIGRVFLLYAIPAIPFFLGGICISLSMTHLAEDISRLYFFDLVGAAGGCLLVIPLLNWLGGPQSMLALSILAALTSFLFLPPKQSVRLKAVPLALLLLLVGALVSSFQHPFLRIKHVKGREEGKALFTQWNSFSRITVVRVNNQQDKDYHGRRRGHLAPAVQW